MPSLGALAALADDGAVELVAVVTQPDRAGDRNRVEPSAVKQRALELGLSNVATPNTRSTGYAPASKLSVELSQIAVAQGSTKLENGSPQVGYYGYDNDLVNTAGQREVHSAVPHV